jgi:hypothetical protein
MLQSYLGPLLLVTAGAAAGVLLTWGLMSYNHQAQPATPSPSPALALEQPIPARTHQSPEPVESSERATETRSNTEAAVVQPTPSPTARARKYTGLPLGVRPDAVNMDVYKRLPGVQPPLINTDGRDLGPEAIQMLETNRPVQPFPGANPNVSVTPMPFPESAAEANEQAKVFAVPSPSPFAQ